MGNIKQWNGCDAMTVVGRRDFLGTMALTLLGAGPMRAQSPNDAREEFTAPSTEPSHDKTVVQQWRVGMAIAAEGAGPTDWPDQQTRVVAKDTSPGVSIGYKPIEGLAKDIMARQMVIRIPAIRAGEQAKAVVTFEIKRFLPAAPKDTARFALPNLKTLERKVSQHLLPSPLIESNSSRIKKFAQEIGSDKKNAWDKVEAIYDWVREKIKFVDNRADEPKGTAQTLEDGVGDCDEMSSLFIAICRAAKVPARMVRVPNHVFPEFYLSDEEDKGTWFPCQASGTRAFGSMFDPRPILQKGDNLVIVDPKTKQKVHERFVRETLLGVPMAGTSGGTMKPKTIYELVKD
jgi:hypothetical protein